MATIDECFRVLKYRANKAGFLGTISPDDFNLLWPRCERRLFNKYYSQYLRDQKIGSALIPFKSIPTPITVDGTGQYNKPSDLLHIDSVRHTVSGIQYEVKRVEDDRLANHLSSSYDAPNLDFPIYTEYSTYLQFNPVNLATATLVYLQDLADSFWGYTITGNKPVYNVATSVQPKWKDTEIDEIIYMIGADIGINMRDQQFEAFSERKTQQPV